MWLLHSHWIHLCQVSTDWMKLENDNFVFYIKAQGLSHLSVRDFLKSIQLENLVELFEREQVNHKIITASCDVM